MNVDMISRDLISRVACALALFTILLTVPAAPSAQAQMTDDPVTSDRPGFSNAAATVSQGTFQAELGYDLSQNTTGEEALSTHSLGLLLLRYGVTDRIEFRANVGSIGFDEQVQGPGLIPPQEGDTELESGYNGAALEAKIKLFENATTTVSGFSSTSVPLSTGPFESADDRSRQTLALLLDGALGQNITLTVNGGANFFWDAGLQEDREVAALFIPTLSFAIDDQAGAYVGYFGQYRDTVNTNFVEGGFTYLVSPNTQIDLNGGFRVDDNEDGFFVGVGLSQRF